MRLARPPAEPYLPRATGGHTIDIETSAGLTVAEQDMLAWLLRETFEPDGLGLDTPGRTKRPAPTVAPAPGLSHNACTHTACPLAGELPAPPPGDAPQLDAHRRRDRRIP